MDVGNVVKANETPLLTIERMDPIYADFTIPQNQLTSVQQNMKAGTLKVEVRLPDEPARPIEGALTFLDNAVADATGTVKLRATAANPERRLWPGRFVQVRLLLSTIPGAILVPAVAPQLSAKGPFVYVVKPDSTAEMRPVVTGTAPGRFDRHPAGDQGRRESRRHGTARRDSRRQGARAAAGGRSGAGGRRGRQDFS